MTIVRKEGAVFDEIQEELLNDIEFFSDGYTITASRGHSAPLEQLRLIERFAREDGLLLKPFVHDNLYDKQVIDGEEVYLWVPTWRALLDCYHATNGKKGKLINPPLAALYKDRLIKPSPHIVGGVSGVYPIDFSGKVKLRDGSKIQGLDIVVDILHQAKRSGVRISNITKEVGNNCAHADFAKKVST